MLGCNRQMHMIGHQHISVNGAVIFPGLLGLCIEVVDIVLFCIETGAMIIAALIICQGIPGTAIRARLGT